ncbi:MAG TPA: hypothetical protein VGR72_02810 [Candidatus Acidoferrales bacterium]|nr:hypothetical protein [Candidatus Acidoferrales bacterium]
MTAEKFTDASHPRINKVEVYWHTVTYRTILMYAFVITVLILAGSYLLVPDRFMSIVNHLADAMQPKASTSVTAGLRGAHFVNLDGKVQVKKVNSVQWVNADYQMSLDKGDLIQTGQDGVARIAFADTTQYTVQADTFVTVEENMVPPNSPSSVGVHISAGAVDLTTGSWQIPGSKAEVSFQDAVASLRPNSRADVRTDPSTNKNEITVAAGTADVKRGGEQVEVGQWQRASFTGGGPITKADVLAPPDLVQPVNLQPIIVPDPKHAAIRFEWKTVSTAREYELQVSDSNTFGKLLVDHKTVDSTDEITGLAAGQYYWTVKAIDAKYTVSEPAGAFQFTLAEEDKGQDMPLTVDDIEFVGKAVEVVGHTEPGATLIVNGEAVADIGADGKFRYFTQPMTSGDHVLVITGQDRRGRTNIKKVPVVVP